MRGQESARSSSAAFARLVCKRSGDDSLPSAVIFFFLPLPLSLSLSVSFPPPPSFSLFQYTCTFLSKPFAINTTGSRVSSFEMQGWAGRHLDTRSEIVELYKLLNHQHLWGRVANVSNGLKRSTVMLCGRRFVVG